MDSQTSHPTIEIVPPRRTRRHCPDSVLCLCCNRPHAPSEMDQDGCGICDECLGVSDMPSALSTFEDAFEQFPDGYMEGVFEGRRWSATVRRSLDRRRTWMLAEELGGNEIVSFNWYRLSEERGVLKPCEMSVSKVIDFVLGFRIDPRLR